MKVIIAPDSFKNSLGSDEICSIVSGAASSVIDNVDIVSMPLCDGGEGTAKIMATALDGLSKYYSVQGPFGDEINAFVAFIDNGKTAIIESAQAVGHTLALGRLNPLKASTYGIGQMILNAVDDGAERIILTLGGSCTNDCGAGLLSALGVIFYDKSGNIIRPVGGNLSEIQSFEFSESFSRFANISFTVMCDVENPLLGINGCAAVYAPQKGANESDVELLEAGDRHFADVVKQTLQRDARDMKGAGAAGGLGFCALTFLNAEMKSGIDVMLSIYNFEDELKDTNLIITGEGSFDRQSLMGKTIGGILSRRKNTDTVIFCGITDGSCVPEGCHVVPIGEGLSVKESIEKAPQLLKEKAEAFFKKYKKQTS